MLVGEVCGCACVCACACVCVNDGGCEFVPRLPRSCSSWLVNYCPTTPVQTSAGETNTG